MVGGIATNEITAIGSGSAEAEAVEAALKSTASKTLVVTLMINGELVPMHHIVQRVSLCSRLRPPPPEEKP